MDIWKVASNKRYIFLLRDFRRSRLVHRRFPLWMAHRTEGDEILFILGMMGSFEQENRDDVVYLEFSCIISRGPTAIDTCPGISLDDLTAEFLKF